MKFTFHPVIYCDTCKDQLSIFIADDGSQFIGHPNNGCVRENQTFKVPTLELEPR